MAKIKIALIFSFLIISVQFQADSLAEDAAESVGDQWRIKEAKHCTILYHPDVDLEKVNRQVKVGFCELLLDRSRRLLNNKGAEEQLAEKFDRIFQQAERILDMFPRKIHLKVKIYKNQAQLDDAYTQIFGRADGKQRVSYYVHKYTTIYTTEKAASCELIAHEMGHAVIDHYFLILPPEKIKELLAQYVEIHLNELEE